MLCLEPVLTVVFLLLLWGVGGGFFEFCSFAGFLGEESGWVLFCSVFELLSCSSEDLTELLQPLHSSRADWSMNLDPVI